MKYVIFAYFAYCLLPIAIVSKAQAEGPLTNTQVSRPSPVPSPDLVYIYHIYISIYIYIYTYIFTIYIYLPHMYIFTIYIYIYIFDLFYCPQEMWLSILNCALVPIWGW